MKIPFKRLSDKAILPTYATPASAGADLYAAETVSIRPRETVLVHTGVALAIPEGYGGFIYARSGLASKRGLAPANKVGVIDADYRGEIMVALYNQSDKEETVEAGERIAQLVIDPVYRADFEETEELDGTLRGDCGFGSTGKK